MAGYPTVTAVISIGSSPKRTTMRGTGPVIANARSELNSKLAVTPCTVFSIRESTVGNPADYSPHAASEFQAMTLVLSKAGSQDHLLTIPNASTAYMIAGDVKGRVDVTNTDIIAIGNAHYDADGVSGWTVTSGFYSND